MDFAPTEKVALLRDQVEKFFATDILPRHPTWCESTEDEARGTPAFMHELRAKAYEMGLWNLGLPNLRDDDRRFIGLVEAPRDGDARREEREQRDLERVGRVAERARERERARAHGGAHTAFCTRTRVRACFPALCKCGRESG